MINERTMTDKEILDLVFEEIESDSEDDDVVLDMNDFPEDKIETIEQIVGDHDPDDIIMTGLLSWDDLRLSVAIDPKYTDRCRNHPCFKSLIGRGYKGKIFE